MEQKKALNILASAIFLSGIVTLLFFVEQDQFYYIFLAYSVTFLGFYGIIQNGLSLVGILTLIALTRIITLFSFPALSDDIYRYMWDGLQWTQGNNPFSYLPSQQVNASAFEQMLIQRMNSPNYYSIYPPVLQLIFYIVADTFPPPLVRQVCFLKGIILFIEALGILATIFLLKKWNLPLKRIALYSLNPLIIVELLGNIHFEVIMIAFLAIAILCLSCKKHILGSIFLSLSILSKMTTLIILPFLFKKMNLPTFIKVASVTLLSVILGFTLILWGSFENFMMSLNLYFQKFEFNASIYFLFRYIGKSIIGYNPIYVVGPLLSIISAITIVFTALIQKKSKGIQNSMLYLLIGYTCYLLMSTTVHPWYLSTLLFISIFTQFRYIQIWSYLIILSYSLYHEDGGLYYWCITLEYVILSYFLYRDLSFLNKSFIPKSV